MTEQTEDHDPERPEEDEDDQTEGDRILTLSHVNEKIDRLAARLEQFFKDGASKGVSKTPTQAAEAEDRRSEIREELQNLRKQERAERQQQTHENRIKTLERNFEKAPRELRRIEKLMKWEHAE